MDAIQWINWAITAFFLMCYIYQIVYVLIPFIKKAPVRIVTKPNRFAVLICARNEEKVIADLINSLHMQTYDQNRISVFVIADNCADGTAAIARAAGAAVYERENKKLIGKGYALEHLLKCIAQDYPQSFDGYFVFDADNILEPDYIENMNRTFSDGNEVVTSYRNSKNYGDNWLTAGSALAFLRESKYTNYPRALLKTSCAISGTGFLFSQKILDGMGGNWPFHLLTEDIEFSVHHVLKGVKIGFCANAELYDEQPNRFSQLWKQRLRWAKGFLQVFRSYGAQLFSGAARGSFACFNMSMTIMPAVLLSVVSLLSSLAIGIIALVNGESLLVMGQSALLTLGKVYLMTFVIGVITTATEWKKIHASPWKKILYTLTFPLFMFLYIPIAFVALFSRVEWKPIEHGVCSSAHNENAKELEYAIPASAPLMESLNT
ncbi:MAG: glycosyltransferase [Oscillospiraceae bacterium]|jgi:cellulose synthase/poly-beta-1,6-N-acetylglucosamine synthase-like glycosyltransferase|nr:glycosyltransferase [Oscillospiraceae bacterium]